MRRERHTQPSRQQTRIGVKGDPTPDAEYKDDPPVHESESEDVSNKVDLKCEDCGNTYAVKREKFFSSKYKHKCYRMVFRREIGEVPCGGQMVRDK